MSGNLDICIVGLGGVGNIVANSLFAFIRGKIMGWTLRRLTFIDADAYSESNIPRQMAAGVMLGHNKAEAWKTIYERSRWNNNGTEFEAHPEWVTTNNVERIVQHSVPTVVFACVDNFPARLVLSRWVQSIVASEYRTPVVVIQGGCTLNYANADCHGIWLDSDNRFVEVGRPTEEGHPEVVEDTSGDRSAMSCEELALSPSGDQTYPDNFMAAAQMMFILFTLLGENGAEIMGKYVGEMAEITKHYYRIDKNIGQGFPGGGDDERTDEDIPEGDNPGDSDPGKVPAHEETAADPRADSCEGVSGREEAAELRASPGVHIEV